MALSPGTRLGPYEILSALGAGGMGEVYRARDTKLDREVAIKVVPELFASDPERVARFQREAKTLAALNHPHIGGIYGLEDTDGVRALVLELVEGPTLADRIAQGPIPLDEALPIARQICEALEAAHEQGIIHRDLKPANIKLRPDGAVKVLDFGLAKALEPTSAASPNVTGSPTITTPAMMTGIGIILGTAAYMAPEQARGKPIDKRADIWAFGVVLYEMLSSQKLFEGETISDTLAGVLTKEPDWDRVPVKAQRLLKRCLEKDPRRRLRDIGDAWSLLDDSPAPVRARRAVPWTMAAAVAVVFALALWVPWRSTRSEDAPTAIALDFDLGPNVSLGLGVVGPPFALSKDGTQIAYVSEGPD